MSLNYPTPCTEDPDGNPLAPPTVPPALVPDGAPDDGAGHARCGRVPPVNYVEGEGDKESGLDTSSCPERRSLPVESAEDSAGNASRPAAQGRPAQDSDGATDSDSDTSQSSMELDLRTDSSLDDDMMLPYSVQCTEDEYGNRLSS